MTGRHVTVVDYGAGNLLSVARALEACSASVTLASNEQAIMRAELLILPGVGSFAHAMAQIVERGLVAPLKARAKTGTPLLGICLGMQMLFDESHEFGLNAGLGLIPGSVQPIPSFAVDGTPQVVPHIGWGALAPTPDADWSKGILADTKPGDAVYFVHSFTPIPVHAADAVAHCVYGEHSLLAVAQRDNVVGTQFHPEKSGDVGLKMLRRFLDS